MPYDIFGTIFTTRHCSIEVAIHYKCKKCSVNSEIFARIYFIFANSVQRHICDPQSSELRHDLHVSVNDDVNLLFREGFIFTKTSHICEVLRK